MSSDKLNEGFLKTKKSFAEKIKAAFTGSIDEDLYEELIEILVLSDVDYATAEKIIKNAVSELKRQDMTDIEAVKQAVRNSALSFLADKQEISEPLVPCLILVAGVNGAGKTTTIAKLAARYKSEGKTVMLAAADTFRAAASEQLSIWAERLQVPIVKSTLGQDAAGVIYDAAASAAARSIDVLLCDTAGRLQNKANLMNEFGKIWRVCEKQAGERHIYELLVLDAMTGQNSLNQFEEFAAVKKPDGIILTKTDGAAKGGIILTIASRCDVPVWYVGTGEGVDDIAEFDAEAYVNAII